MNAYIYILRNEEQHMKQTSYINDEKKMITDESRD